MKISAIIIARNEANRIEDCLKSLSFVEEIVLVDNGSKDETLNIAKKYHAEIVEVQGLDFSYLRNIGREKAKGIWLLYIDADERISLELQKEILSWVNKKTPFQAYNLLRQNYFLGKKWPKTEYIVRLMKKNVLIGWQGALHETPIINGKIGFLQNLMLHYTHRSLKEMIEKTNEWSEIEATLRYQNNHPPMTWWRFMRVIISSFYQTFVFNEGYKAGTVGLIESIYQAYSMFITYAKLWEKQNKAGFKNAR